MSLIGSQSAAVGKPVTLDADEEWIGWADPGLLSGIVTLACVFSSDWDGTVSFDALVKSEETDETVTELTDTILATNVTSGTANATTTGTANSTEFYRLDAAGLHGVRARITTYTDGTVTITPCQTPG